MAHLVHTPEGSIQWVGYFPAPLVNPSIAVLGCRYRPQDVCAHVHKQHPQNKTEHKKGYEESRAISQILLQ